MTFKVQSDVSKRENKLTDQTQAVRWLVQLLGQRKCEIEQNISELHRSSIKWTSTERGKVTNCRLST